MRRWEIELGGHNRFHLRIASADAVGRAKRLAVARQSMVYDVSLRGVEISAQLKLEAYDEPLRQATFRLDPQVRLVAALCGDVPAPWSVESPPGSPMTRVVVTLPEPIRGGAGMLRLRALAPLATGEPWRLPRICPEGMFWQEGAVTLLIAAPLAAERLIPIGCRQTAAAPLPTPRTGESLQFECFSPDATVELSLARRRGAVRAASATETELGAGKMTSRVTAEFRTADATLFQLEAQLSPPWEVLSVESAPAAALEDWTVERSKGRSTLVVRLAKALCPSRSVRLTISARRFYPAAPGALALEDLLPLHFAALGGNRELVAVRAADPFALKTAGDERLTRILPGDLDPDELDLFSQAPGELALVNDAGAAGLKLSLQNRKPSFAATIAVEARWATRRSRRIIASVARLRRRRRSIASWCGWGDDAKSPCSGRWKTTTSRR